MGWWDARLAMALLRSQYDTPPSGGGGFFLFNFFPRVMMKENRCVKSLKNFEKKTVMQKLGGCSILPIPPKLNLVRC